MKKIIWLIFFFSFGVRAQYAPFDDPFPAKKTVGSAAHSMRVPEARGPIGAVAWFSLRFFQIFLSPQDGPNCMYSPTCSRYAIIVLHRHGSLTGTLMASDRVLRCNPFGYPGYDPPEENHFPVIKKRKSVRTEFQQ